MLVRMEQKFSFRIFRKDDGALLAIADKGILGKKFKKKGLEIGVSKDFYYQGFCTEKKALAMMKEASAINAIGKNIVGLMVENKIITKESVLYPCGIEHAQVFGV